MSYQVIYYSARGVEILDAGDGATPFVTTDKDEAREAARETREFLGCRATVVPVGARS